MGLLDGPMRGVAKTLVSTLGTSAVPITRRSVSLDPATDTETPATSTKSVPMTPPAPFDRRRVDGSAILASDLMALVAAQAVDEAGLDLSLASHITLSLVYDGVTYQIVGVRHVRSGDQAAALELQLRA